MDFEERRKNLFFALPALVGIIFIGVLGGLNFRAGRMGVAVMDLLLIIALAAGLAALRQTRMGIWHNRLTAAAMSVTFLYCLYLGGTDGAFIFWSFLVPIVAHFMMGKNEGLAWSLAFFVLVSVLFALPAERIGAYAFPLSIKVRALMALAMVTLLTNRYEWARQVVQRELSSERQNLRDVNATLLRLKTAMEQSLDGIAVAGMDQRVQYANPAWAAMHGMDVAEAAGRRLSIFHTSEQDAEEVQPFIKMVLDRGQGLGEVSHVTKGGRVFPCWMAVSLLKNDDGEPLGLVAVARDVTERKRAEEALRASEERSRTLLEVTPDAVTVYDPQGNVVYINPAFERIFGWTCQELTGGPLEFVPPYERQKTRAALEQLRSGKTTLIETQRFNKDGRLLDIQASAAMFRDRDGGPGGAIVISRDITERKKAEKALTRAKEAAESANQAKSQFVANISHEIRTPMNGVIGMINILLDTDLTEEQREYAMTVSASASNLLAVINQVLDFSKMEAGKFDLERIDFDPRAVIEDVCDLMAVKAQEKGLEFVCMVDPDVPALMRGDPGRLRQVLINLANNAIKFTSQGEVSIRVQKMSMDPPSVHLRFSVSDTGLGIPEDRHHELFSPFMQVDASSTREYEGAGLGLSISKRLVDMMDGEIGLTSKPGEGSCFWFEIPFEMQPQQEKAAPADIQGQRILVVDDNATNRRLLMVLLNSWGCRPEEAAGAHAALEMLLAAEAGQEPFSVVITDMQMPRMDGEALGRAIRADKRLSGVRLVMMTSIGDRGDAVRLEELGFSAYLTKPVKQSLLLDCLQTILSEDDNQAGSPKPRILTRHSIAKAKISGSRILLVEDNLVNRQVASTMLHNLGHRVESAANGQEALEMASQDHYDLVLMDCQMPVMDGYEATRRMRRPESGVLNTKAPIIAMTAHAMTGDRDKCLEAGMDDYISKPVDAKSLGQLLEKWLSGRPASSGEPSPEPVLPAAGAFDKKDFLARMLDDETLAAVVIQTFLQDAPVQIDGMKEAFSQGDLGALAIKAHTLGGASGNVGAGELRETARALENVCAAGESGGIGELIKDAENRLERLKNTLVQQGLASAETGE